MLSFDPSAQEQYLLELTNRLRQDPAAELRQLLNSSNPQVAAALAFFAVDTQLLREQWASLAPAAPLAFDAALWQAARAHSELMLEHDLQAHQLPGEPTLRQRVQAAGYAGTYVGENVYAYALDLFYAHAALAIDWGPGPGGIQEPAWHRVNLLNPQFRDVGIGVVVAPPGAGSSVGPLLVTQDFGRRTNPGPAQLLGVVYQDADRDGFYSVGEGLGGVTVTATGTAGTFTTTTWTAGGYQLALPPGDYTVTFSGGPLGGPRSFTTTIAADHVKLDLRTGPLPRVRFAAARTVHPENGGPLRILVTLSRPVASPVTVTYAVLGGTATAGEDYHLGEPSLTFAPGQTRRWIVIDVVNDRLDEPTETMVLTLTGPTAALLGGRHQFVASLLDDDPPPWAAVAIDPATMQLVVTLARPSGKPVQLDVVIRGGGSVQIHTVSLAPGQTTERLDASPAVHGPFRVRLARPVRARLASAAWLLVEG